MPTGAGITPALAAVARPKASAALNTIVRTILCSFPMLIPPYRGGFQSIKTNAMNRG
jgi:hypothetical protein